MSGSWKKSGFFKTLEGRIAYGVPAHLIDLCKIENIGKVRANKLYDAGVKTAKDIALCDPQKLCKIVNMKIDAVNKMIKQAQGL
jgi:helicase